MDRPERHSPSYEDAETVSPYAEADTISPYADAPTNPSMERQPEISLMKVYDHFAANFFNLELSESDQSKVIQALGEINQEEARTELPSAYEEQEALVQRAAIRALGHRVEHRFSKDVGDELYERKKQIDNLLERLALNSATRYSQEKISTAVSIIKRGEYWRRTPQEVRTHFDHLLAQLGSDDVDLNESDLAA